MSSLSIHVPSESALESFAAALAKLLPPQAFVALYGDLGAGKTTLVKAIAAAAGIDPTEGVSPTFGLIHEYQGCGYRSPAPDSDPAPRRIVHADMYRLPDAAALHETGWDDATAGDCWVFVEWPERIAAALPANRLDIEISIDSPTARTLVLEGRGPRHEPIVSKLRAAGTAGEPDKDGDTRTSAGR